MYINRESYLDLATDYEELCRDYEHLKEEYHQQEEILDGIESILKTYLDRETADHIYNMIFKLEG